MLSNPPAPFFLFTRKTSGRDEKSRFNQRLHLPAVTVQFTLFKQSDTKELIPQRNVSKSGSIPKTEK